MTTCHYSICYTLNYECDHAWIMREHEANALRKLFNFLHYIDPPIDFKRLTKNPISYDFGRTGFHNFRELNEALWDNLEEEPAEELITRGFYPIDWDEYRGNSDEDYKVARCLLEFGGNDMTDPEVIKLLELFK